MIKITRETKDGWKVEYYGKAYEYKTRSKTELKKIYHKAAVPFIKDEPSSGYHEFSQYLSSYTKKETGEIHVDWTGLWLYVIQLEDKIKQEEGPYSERYKVCAKIDNLLQKIILEIERKTMTSRFRHTT